MMKLLLIINISVLTIFQAMIFTSSLDPSDTINYHFLQLEKLDPEQLHVHCITVMCPDKVRMHVTEVMHHTPLKNRDVV